MYVTHRRMSAYTVRGENMDNCALPVGVSALACAIAQQFENTDELALLAAVLTQLGDTLDTIAAQRALCETSSQITITQ